jgi:rhodanese-related sulfurtransferase
MDHAVPVDRQTGDITSGVSMVFRNAVLLWFISSLAVFSGSSFAADEFPMRARYPDVPIMTRDDLNKQYGNVLIIDVRTKYEYDTLHIKDAINVPLSTTFGAEIHKLRQGNGKTFVFYCNGKTCHKSYEAVVLADRARVNNIYAYDAGIFDWAKTYPERTTLRGTTPIRPDDLIDIARFKQHLIDPKDFAARVGPDSVVLDVRDRAQRDTQLFPFHEKRAQLDETAKLNAVIEDAKAHNKVLLVYDQVGKQVQWFQYHLEGMGLKNYYFMKGGAQGYFDETLGKVVLGGEAKALAK